LFDLKASHWLWGDVQLMRGLGCAVALLGACMLGVDGLTYEQWMTEDPMVSTAFGHAKGLLEVGVGCCSSNSSSLLFWAVLFVCFKGQPLVMG
jgi:hypothetical protein